jgi:hypothetical protein
MMLLRACLAKAEVVTMDGGRRSTFAVTVVPGGISVAGLKADDLQIGKKNAPRSPDLHWEPGNA